MPVFCGSKNLLLFGDLRQGGAPLGGEVKTIWWVYFVGGKGSVWLADMVEEVLGVPKKGEFARSFNDEVRVLKIWMGSNRAGCFLEAAVFVEGGRKGVIRLPKDRGGLGWWIFMEELRPLSAHLVAKVLPAVGNVGVGGRPPSYAEVLAAPLGGLKPACGEALVSDLGRWFSTDGATCLTELLRSLAMEFLAKMRVESGSDSFLRFGHETQRVEGCKEEIGPSFISVGPEAQAVFWETPDYA